MYTYTQKVELPPVQILLRWNRRERDDTAIIRFSHQISLDALSFYIHTYIHKGGEVSKLTKISHIESERKREVFWQNTWWAWERLGLFDDWWVEFLHPGPSASQTSMTCLHQMFFPSEGALVFESDTASQRLKICPGMKTTKAGKMNHFLAR